jgi:hypothetical protein
MTCLNLLLIPLIILSPDFVDFYILFGVYLANLSHFFFFEIPNYRPFNFSLNFV